MRSARARSLSARASPARACLELRFERLDLGRPAALLQVLQRRAGLGNPAGGLVARGGLGFGIEGEERITGLDLCAAFHRKYLERAGAGAAT